MRLPLTPTLYLVLCICVLAQNPSAGVVGSVADPSGAMVVDAAVVVRNIDTNDRRTVATDLRGEFTVTNLTPGKYEVVVEKTGFKTLKEHNLELQLNQTARLVARLEIGATATSIEIAADVPQINTENATKGDVITPVEIAQMPLESRDFSDLAFLVPGVAQSSDIGSPFAVSGARADNTNFLVGGVSFRDPRFGAPQNKPNIEALQEFKMETSGFSAEYGRMAGGVVNMALKTGTNQLHGSLYEFVRNDLLDARNFFADTKQKLRRNQFGGLISGPVRIPHVFNGKDRTFFLFSWESFRQVNGATNLSRVPTPEERAGDFSQTRDVQGRPVLLKDPFVINPCTQQNASGCFAGGRIPLSRFNPIALKILPYWPLPNRPGQANNNYASAVNRGPSDSYVIKLDHRFSDQDSISFQYLPRFGSSLNPFDGSELGTFGVTGTSRNGIFGLSYTRIMTPTLVNEFRAGLNRITGTTSILDAGHNFAAEWGISGFTTDPVLQGFPRVAVRGLAGLGDNQMRPYDFTVNTFQYTDVLTWIKGRHQMRFGAQFYRNQDYQSYFQNNRGLFNFLGNLTGQPFGDFLLGLLDSVSRQVTVPRNYIQWSEFGVFAQDDFKVASRLTLNLGIRYDLPKPQEDKYGRSSNFVPALGKIIISDDRTIPDLTQLAAASGLAGRIGVARDYGLPSALVYPNQKDVAPRFGFAWRPFGGNRTVVRGGYGIFYGTLQQQPMVTNLSDIFPFVISQTVNRTQFPAVGAIDWANPFKNTNGASSVNFNGYDTNPAPQYLQNWSLTAERGLGSSAALELAYVGSKGTHLGRTEDINQVLRDQRLPGGGFARPYPFVQNAINYYVFDGNSIYNAGTLTLRRRFNHGFFYRVNYTYSKSIDDASTSSQGGNGAPQRTQDPNNRHGERGRSNFDTGHSVTMDYSYLLPSPRGRNWFRGLQGWQLAGTGRAYTGQPFTPRVATVNLNQGGAFRPDRLSKGTLPDPGPERWFDLAAFPPVPVGVFKFGSSGRNILDGPGYFGVNASLIKNTRLREKTNLQFRWECFNIFNHTNFSQPVVNVDNPTGGTITGAGPARAMQLALRLEF